MSPSIPISPEMRKEMRDRDYFYGMLELYGLYRPTMPKDFMPEVTAHGQKMVAEHNASKSDSGSSANEAATNQRRANPDDDRYLLFPNGTLWETEGEGEEKELRELDIEKLVEEARGRPSIPIEERWYRQADWRDTRRKLVAMVKSGNIEPTIPKDREQEDGSVREVQTPIWQLWPKTKDIMAQLNLDGAKEELREIQFMAKLMDTINPVLKEQFSAKAVEVSARHDPARAARIMREHGQEIPQWLKGLLAEREEEDRPPTPEPAPEPVQRRQQAPLNRNERRAAERRQKRRS